MIILNFIISIKYTTINYTLYNNNNTNTFMFEFGSISCCFYNNPAKIKKDTLDLQQNVHVFCFVLLQRQFLNWFCSISNSRKFKLSYLKSIHWFLVIIFLFFVLTRMYVQKLLSNKNTNLYKKKNGHAYV